MFAESRPEVIEDMRQAADELRVELAGDLVTFVVNRNINVSNICTVGCAFCGFGVGKRSPDAYEHSRADFVRRVHEAVAYGATEICMQSGIHPDWDLEDYLGWPRRRTRARAARTPAPAAPAPAAGGPRGGGRRRTRPKKRPVGGWGEIIGAAHRVGLRSTVTVM